MTKTSNNATHILFGERLKKIREDRGLSLREFGESLGLSAMSVIRYETAQRSPDLQTILNIINTYDVSPSWLIGEDISATEENLISIYKSLSEGDKVALIKYAMFLKEKSDE